MSLECTSPHYAPFTQRLHLGWVLDREVCLGNSHKPTVNAFKTNVFVNGWPSLLKPCSSFLSVTGKFLHVDEPQVRIPESSSTAQELLGQTVFSLKKNDNKLASSIEDEIFLKLMNKEVHRNETSSWVAPLLFRKPRPWLPNNREQAVKSFASLQRSFKRRLEMQQQYVAFMGKMFENDHAEVSPTLGEGEEGWYLPTFRVFHPQKPVQIRVKIRRHLSK